MDILLSSQKKNQFDSLVWIVTSQFISTKADILSLTKLEKTSTPNI